MSLLFLNDQIHRRKASLTREFRKALEDGKICEQEEEDIEKLRKELGISIKLANEIRADVHEDTLIQQGICKTCGRELD